MKPARKKAIQTKFDMIQISKEYMDVIDKIEKTTSPEKLQSLEENRAQLHWKFIEGLKKLGIKFKDRDHATRIALRMARGEQ